MKRLLLTWLALMLMPLALQVFAQTPACATNSPTSPGGITPTNERFPGGDPICTTGSIGYRFNDPAIGQTVYNDGYGNTITINVSSTDCGEVLTWTASGNIVVDKVFAKGGTDQNVYDYTGTNPRATTDGNLHCPVNNSGNYAAFSHVDFCFRYKLTVSKTAETSFTREYKWTIDKSVLPATWNFFKGDKGTSTYTIKVEDDGYTDKDWAVSGTITVENNTPLPATITAISDVLGGGVTGNVNCSVSFPYVLASGATLNCGYTASLASGTNGTNTATVTTSSASVLGGSGTANYTFGNPTTEVNKSVNISDDKYTPTTGWTATWGKDETFTYTKEFTCDDKGEYKNTATIVETGQKDNATVTVNCYDLKVTKTAATSLTRTWDWTIDKSADQTALTLSAGQIFAVNYTVKVDAGSTDSKWAVSGSISVENPAPMAAVINNISDIVSPDITASVNCGVSFPFTLAAGATLTCTYSVDLPDATARTNTATATLQNYSTAADGTKSASGTTDYSGTASVDFSTATITKVDECADVSDNLAGALGNVCASAVPKTYNYSYNVGPFTTPGIYTVTNVATVTTGSGTKKDDSWGVTVTIPGQGCTLTQGYWKTHSKSGPAPYDDAWRNLGAGEENTPFFLSGQSWLQVFRTPPAGNAYYNLAHQYMAAKLNILNGASAPTAVTAAIASAENLFNTYTPNQMNNQLARTFRNLASTLDQYNNGLIGPGHCDEATTSVSSSSAAAPVADVVEQQQVIPQAAIGLKAWPNPSATAFTIRYGTENLQAPVKIRVFDMNGKLVYAANGQANRTLSFGEGFAKGIYLLEVTQENQRQTMRLVKQ